MEEEPGQLIWDRQARGRLPRGGLDVGRIAEAAVSLADAEGLEAVSMRRLATELGSGTMSLFGLRYWLVSTCCSSSRGVCTASRSALGSNCEASDVRLPMCRGAPPLPVTYHPPQRSAKGLFCVVMYEPALRIG